MEEVLKTDQKAKEQQTSNQNEHQPQDQKSNVASDMPHGPEWGFDLYPNRRKPKDAPVTNLMQGKGRENIDQIKCERTVYDCIKTSPLVKLMMAALKSSGCAIDIRRHISCEECSPTVSGGYDPGLNQIVICQNVVSSKGVIQGILTHEMIHMFDYCRNKLDFKNIDHLACTEVRAANLTHCSYISALMNGDIHLGTVKEMHQICVKNKALASILAVRKIAKADAIDAVERVFPKCYSDLEPIGRRLRRGSEDMYKAYAEASYYGYD